MNKLIAILMVIAMLAGCTGPTIASNGSGRAVAQIVPNTSGKAFIVVVADGITLCEVTFEDNLMSDTIACKRAVIE